MIAASLLRTGSGRRTHALVLFSFLGFQALDALTTHLGLQLQHPELNRLLAPVLNASGELGAYAIKAMAVAALLTLLMLLQYHKPRVWQAFHVAAWVSAVAVIANIYQLIA